MARIDVMTVRVSPEVMRAQAQEVLNKAQSVEKRLKRVKEIIEGTGSHWEGEAGNLHRDIFKGQWPQIEEVIRRVKEHPADLGLMATNYEQAEASNVNKSTALPDSLLS